MIVPNNIRKLYRIVIVLIIISILLGLVLGKSELYFAYVIGALGSMAIIYTLNREVYEMVYVKEKNIRSPFGYYKRLFIIAMSLLIVSLISKKLFPQNIETNILATGVGLLTSKLSILLTKIKNK